MCLHTLVCDEVLLMKRKAEKQEKAGEVRYETPGASDAKGIYRLHVPMEAYHLFKDHQRVAGGLAEFVNSVIPCLTGDADCRKSILRILASRFGEDTADGMIDAFVFECRAFLTELVLAMQRFDLVQEGEKIAHAKVEKDKALEDELKKELKK